MAVTDWLREKAGSGQLGGAAAVAETAWQIDQTVPDDVAEQVTHDDDPTANVILESSEVITDGIKTYSETPGGQMITVTGGWADDAAEAADPENWIPNWLPLAAGGIGGLLVMAVLAYTFGQLFNVNIGS